MRVRAARVLAGALAAVLCGCGSTQSKSVGPPTVVNFALNSKLLGRQMFEVLVVPVGGARGRPLLVFLHGYGASPSGMLSPGFMSALRRLGDRAPAVFFPEGDFGWWHDRADGRWGSYVLREGIPAALKRSGADPQRVAIGGISMGGFGALDLGRLASKRFCAVGGHSPAILLRNSKFVLGAFDSTADFRRHDLLRIARSRSPYRAPVWIDVGAQDELRPAATALARELRADHADLSFHVWPGSHNGRYWDAHFAAYLRFYANACS
jgi:putative tributyrin esterase